MQKYSIWLSFLGHLLFFLSFFFIVRFQSKLEQPPALYVPAYIYHQEVSPVMQQQALRQPVLAAEKTGSEKPMENNATAGVNLHQPTTENSAKNTEPVHLIGEKNVDKPLIVLLGKAITAHLIYPKSAVDFNVKGTAVVRFLLHPDGQVTDVQLLRSSSANVLDKAALDAIYAISPVKKADLYLTQPKFMVIAIIFG